METDAIWRLDGFAASLTNSSDNTVRAYRTDIEGFIQWAARLDVTDPVRVDRLVLRRYVASLTTREFAKRSIARKVSSLRRYFAYLRREGVEIGRAHV